MTDDNIITMLKVAIIGAVLLGILFFIGILTDTTCQRKYGNNWHLTSKGQFFCEDNNGNLKNF